jgi:hypothetical protein
METVHLAVGHQARSSLLSIASQLCFQRTRIAATIRIVHGSRFHLVACVEIASAARIAHALKNCRG